MKNIEQDSLDSWAESHAGRRLVHSNDMSVIIAVVLKTQPKETFNSFWSDDYSANLRTTAVWAECDAARCGNDKLVIFAPILVPLSVRYKHAERETNGQ